MTRFSPSAARGWSQAWAEIVRKHWRKPRGQESSDPDWDCDDGECANCGGEGVTYGCSWDWQCDTWDGDTCLCTRSCDWCSPRKQEPCSDWTPDTDKAPK